MRALRAFWAAMAVALAGSAAAEAAERAAPDTWEPKDYRRVPTAVRWSRRVLRVGRLVMALVDELRK